MGTNSVAIVTGGFARCGRQVARKLAGQGFAVVLNYARNQGQADAAVEEILAADGIALASAPTSRTSSTSSGCSPRRSRRSGVSTSW
jgi:NAD(P)-dependent dehydrogenase (short-subunit alcohol dehydrogenase family)